MVVADDPGLRDVPSLHPSRDCPAGATVLAFCVAGVRLAGEPNAETVIVAVGHAAPLGFTRVPRTIFVQDEPHERTIFPNVNMVAHLRARCLNPTAIAGRGTGRAVDDDQARL